MHWLWGISVVEDNDRQKFFELLTEHATAAGIELKPARMNIYFKKLKRWPMNGIQQALEECFYSCNRFPAIKDIAAAYNSKHNVM